MKSTSPSAGRRGRTLYGLSSGSAAQQQVAGDGDKGRSRETDKAHLIRVHVVMVPMAPFTPILGASYEWG